MQKALIVDDEPHIRTWLDHFLQERGYQNRLCSGVGEALKTLEETCFDFILTDYNMPDGTGGSVLHSAKTLCPGAARSLMTGVLAAVPDADKEMAHLLLEKPNLAAPLHQFLETHPLLKPAVATSF